MQGVTCTLCLKVPTSKIIMLKGKPVCIACVRQCTGLLHLNRGKKAA